LIRIQWVRASIEPKLTKCLGNPEGVKGCHARARRRLAWAEAHKEHVAQQKYEYLLISERPEDCTAGNVCIGLFMQPVADQCIITFSRY
jgi:hypothetical protein